MVQDEVCEEMSNYRKKLEVGEIVSISHLNIPGRIVEKLSQGRIVVESIARPVQRLTLFPREIHRLVRFRICEHDLFVTRCPVCTPRIREKQTRSRLKERERWFAGLYGKVIINCQ